MIKFILFLVIVVVIAWAVKSYIDAQDFLWAEAKRNPFWETQEVTYGGKTYVQLALVARCGKRYESFGSSDLIGSTDIKDPEWQLKLELLRNQAKNRASVLNEARNRKGSE